MTYNDCIEKASALLSEVLVHMSQAQRDEAITRVAVALCAYEKRGRISMRDHIASMVCSCLDRDPTLQKLHNEIEELS